MSRKTMTLAGSEGMSFAADLEVIFSEEDTAQQGFDVSGSMSVGKVCGAAIDCGDGCPRGYLRRGL